MFNMTINSAYFRARNIVPVITFGCIYALLPIVTHARQTQAFYLSDENPFVRIFGLPKPEDPHGIAENTLNMRLGFNVSNSAIHEQIDNEEIIWDGETSTYEISVRYAIKPRLALGLDIPLVVHAGGTFDSVIRRDHKILGLSNDRQQQFRKNNLQYIYRRNGITEYKLQDYTQGLGDVRIVANWQIHKASLGDSGNLSAHSVVKLPTGESATLLGSGGTDIALALSYNDPHQFSHPAVDLVSHLGLLHLGRSDVFSTIQRQYISFANVALSWQYNSVIAVKTQLDFHSSFYNSALPQLGAKSLRLDIGGDVKLGNVQRLEFGMMQNLFTDSTPDFGLFISYYLTAKKI